jgi:hypothetical protein
MAICRHWKRGRCHLGDECGFQHPTERPHELPTSDGGYDEVHFLGHAERMSRVQHPEERPRELPTSEQDYEELHFLGHAERMSRVSWRFGFNRAHVRQATVHADLLTRYDSRTRR